MLTARLCPATRQYHLSGSDDPLAVAANRYLGMLAVRGCSTLTVKSYAFAIARFHRWFAPRRAAIESLQQVDLVPYIAELRAEDARPQTINHRLTVVRSLFRFVTGQPMPWGRGACPPARGPRGGHHDRRLGLRWVKLQQSHILRVKTPQTLVDPLTPDQIKLMLKTFCRYRDLAVVHLMLLCGLRSREVLAMRIDDINATDRCLRVRGKGRKERLVPLPELLVTTLTRYLRLERPRNCNTEFVFVVLQGKRRSQPMTTAGLRSLFRCRRRGRRLKNANPHRFRHTFGTDMARAGVSLTVLQRLLGHAYPDTTMRYVNLSMHDITEAYHRALEVISRQRPARDDAAV